MSQIDPTDRRNDDVTLRLFIAIACPVNSKIEALLNELQVAAREADSAIRVVTQNNLHITLKFLGPAPSSSVAGITAALDQLSAHVKPFVLTLTSTGIFGDAFWLGVNPCAFLSELVSAINKRLEPLGFTREARAFIPHLTVARLKQKQPHKLPTWLRDYNAEAWGSLEVKEIHLFQSESLQTGVEYSILHSSRFKPSA